jgi:hypothetical protein
MIGAMFETHQQNTKDFLNFIGNKEAASRVNYGTVIREELNRSNMRDFRSTASRLGQNASNLTNPDNNPNRIARDGMSLRPTNAPLGQGADLRLDGKHYQLLERIARNTESSPL